MADDDHHENNETLLDHETALQEWERPKLSRLTADGAEGTFAGVGPDNGIYS